MLQRQESNLTNTPSPSRCLPVQPGMDIIIIVVLVTRLPGFPRKQLPTEGSPTADDRPEASTAMSIEGFVGLFEIAVDVPCNNYRKVGLSRGSPDLECVLWLIFSFELRTIEAHEDQQGHRE